MLPIRVGVLLRKGIRVDPREPVIESLLLASLLLMEGEGEMLMRKAIELAQGGVIRWHSGLGLDRIYPVRKGRLINLDLPKVESARDVLKAIGSTIYSVALGRIIPEEGSLVAGLLEAKRKAIETMDIEERLSRLESLQQWRTLSED